MDSTGSSFYKLFEKRSSKISGERRRASIIINFDVGDYSVSTPENPPAHWVRKLRYQSNRLKFSYFVGNQLKFSIFVGSRLNFFIFVGRRKISVNKKKTRVNFQYFLRISPSFKTLIPKERVKLVRMHHLIELH